MRMILNIMLFLFPFVLVGQGNLSGVVMDKDSTILSGVEIFIPELKLKKYNNQYGIFNFDSLNYGDYSLVIYKEGFHEAILNIKHDKETHLTLVLEPNIVLTDVVTVTDNRSAEYANRKLHDVEGVAIYASKKTEVIILDKITANLSTNNPRQVFASIAGLNVWESDGAGLQLGIGARGLDPNRTSNFNTRQNGYDISADALGYPESYYTPPTVALKKIEVIRGAASLQYGPQFGGLLNFILKDGVGKKPFEAHVQLTAGSYDFKSLYADVIGDYKKVNYYAFFQGKEGGGFRKNSDFEQHTYFGHIGYDVTDNIKLNFDVTHMDYLSHQAGGLVDFEFENDPTQSKRDRNWFKVEWNLYNMTMEHKLTNATKYDLRIFHLDARREALGELGPINRPDPLRERDLIKGKYNNWGGEVRILHRYNIASQIQNILIGGRYYNGHTKNTQGRGDKSNQARFELLNPDDPYTSQYLFPSQNVAIFAEHLFNFSPQWSITPGLRYEYIDTNADGSYYNRVQSGNEIIFEEKIKEEKSNERSLALLGIGTTYRVQDNKEFYLNASQNYRSINFTDIAIRNPNLIVDSLLSDERGYNFDIGYRGLHVDDNLSVDISGFYLKYNDRIGIGEIIVDDPFIGPKATAYRTNIGDARIFGLEAYAEYKSTLIHINEKPIIARIFTNLSQINGKYTKGMSQIIDNKVELIPEFSFKCGVTLSYDKLSINYQHSYTSKQYSDATNAEKVADATRGIIPAYQVGDVGLKYRWRFLNAALSVNNIWDASYFTRRATAYPGPGIIPADGRAVYLTIGYIFE